VSGVDLPGFDLPGFDLTGLDLSRTSVFLDFDGTVSTADVGVHVLTRAAPDEWRAIDEQFRHGVIDSRECILDEWELVEGDEATLRAIAAEVGLDPGLGPLVDALRAAGAELTVVSDGFGFYVEDAVRPFGLDVLTNAVDFATRELLFPHEDRCCPCASCGTCKQAPIKDATRRGRATMLIGDGASDRKAALLADVVFAKDALASWCGAFGVDHVAFDTLADVHRLLFP
jgi:2-hydroxy-3-keto-5-methylthiopentenyl-1-phosphate phosphatase